MATGDGLGLTQSVAEDFRAWAKAYSGGGGSFAAALFERCATDAQILSLASEAQLGQPPSLLFFGAVTSTLLDDPADPLAPYLLGEADALKADDVTFAALKDFCGRRHDKVASIIRSRTVQTTSSRRAGVVPALFGHIMRKGVSEPFSLVEVGCSAGLLTIFDQYYFDFGPLGFLGDPRNLPIPGPQYMGKRPPLPRRMPVISQRVGIDLDPIDPGDPAQVNWLEALMPLDAREGREELRRALEWRAGVPLETIADDAMTTVPALLPRLTDTVVVLHANCLYQWPASLQREFHEMLLEQSRARPIYRLGMDLIHDLPGREKGDGVNFPLGKATDMFAVTYIDGRADWDYLGVYDGVGLKAVWMS